MAILEIYFNGAMALICDECKYPIDKFDDNSDKEEVIVCPICYTEYPTPEGFRK